MLSTQQVRFTRAKRWSIQDPKGLDFSPHHQESILVHYASISPTGTHTSLNNLENKMVTLVDTQNGFSETSLKSSSKYHLLSKVRLYLSNALCGDSGAGPQAPTYPAKRPVAYNLVSAMSQAY